MCLSTPGATGLNSARALITHWPDGSNEESLVLVAGSHKTVSRGQDLLIMEKDEVVTSGSALKGRNGTFWSSGQKDRTCEGQQVFPRLEVPRAILHHALAAAKFNKTQNKEHESPTQATLGVPRRGSDTCVTVPMGIQGGWHTKKTWPCPQCKMCTKAIWILRRTAEGSSAIGWLRA